MGITQRIDAITLVEKFQSVLPAPKSVKIELTGRCNFRCGFCALRTRQAQPKDDMDFDLFRRITTEMRDAGVEEIGLFYLGESFMNPALLLDAVKWTKQILSFPYVFLTTNGSLAWPPDVHRLMAAGLDSLKFSMNVSDGVQFREVVGVKTALFDDAIANLKAAKAIRDEGNFKCGIYASSIRYDGEQQKRMEAFLNEHVLPFVDEHYWLPLYSMGAIATQREAELGYKPTAGNQGRLANMREPLPCWAVMTEGHVTASGMLSACCFDADSRWSMADLNQKSFMECWNSEKFVTLREAHIRKDVKGTICEDCVAYR